MDPNANLDEQLGLARDLTEAIENGDELEEDDVERLCDLVHALDGWITGGGFLPTRWKRKEG
jgi:hypothetical protein